MQATHALAKEHDAIEKAIAKKISGLVGHSADLSDTNTQKPVTEEVIPITSRRKSEA
jgi:hypothetical protein